MTYLTALAFDAYVATGLTWNDELLVPRHVIYARLASLSALCDPNSPEYLLVQEVWLARRLGRGADPRLRDLYWLDSQWSDAEEPEGGGWVERLVDTDPEGYVVNEFGSDGKVSACSPQRRTVGLPSDVSGSSPVLELVVSKSKGGLERSWKFHKGDADPYPSIPHGHEEVKGKIKLDAYRGWVYGESGKRYGRESRRAIVKLWNNGKFRSFSLEALQHALAVDPLLARRLRDERGILDPLRLPRKG